MRSQSHNCTLSRYQHGAALLVMLVILVVGATAMLLRSLSSAAIRNERDQITANALAQAKEALIGFAASSDTPGMLPCPEKASLIGSASEGQAQSSCSNSLPVIGRLPWRTLGLGDLRDGNGDKLWYVISAGFRNSPINSDTPAQLTVNGIPNSAVAIIFSAGAPINGQSRPIPTSSTPPDISQYLDLNNNDGDNTFISNGPPDTFNDRLLLVTHSDLFHVVEKRVAAEVRKCLNDYATNGAGLYPWATPTNVLTFNDTPNTLFGRIPDTPFNSTETSNPAMNDTWGAPPNCNISSSSGWWVNWKEIVFYGLSDKYSPNQNVSAPLLAVNPPSLIADKKFVVIVAGKMLTTPLQVRSMPADKSLLSNYLEAPNSSGTPPFSQGAPSTTFNDTVIFQ